MDYILWIISGDVDYGLWIVAVARGIMGYGLWITGFRPGLTPKPCRAGPPRAAGDTGRTARPMQPLRA